MGGHEHGHSYKISSPGSYKIENCTPDFVKFHERLAKEGLKDPWARNDAWRFQKCYGTKGQRALLLARGWKLGIPAFLISIGIDQLLASGKDDHHAHGEHH